jgi:uncharacterized protein
MAAGLPDLVDCARLGSDAASLERVYSLSELPRVQDVLAGPQGSVKAAFAFSRAPSGRSAARVSVRAEPQLVCQRCMKGFAFPVRSGSEVEFTNDEDATASEPERELFKSEAGMVSLRALAEEELLLALPFAAACGDPQSCGNAPCIGAAQGPELSGEMRRPFSALQDLLKKT